MIKLDELKRFPFFKDMKTESLKKLASFAVERKLQKGALMMGDSGRCNGVPLILGGVMRLFRVAENGREINVYNVHAGELCVLAAICTLADFEYDFSAQAKSDCEMAVIPPETFRQLMNDDNGFKAYIFTALADKLVASLRAIEMLNFSSIEDRLRDYLYYNANNSNEVVATHEMIARDIGSSREVVSRQLKKFENEELLSIKRGRVVMK